MELSENASDQEGTDKGGGVGLPPIHEVDLQSDLALQPGPATEHFFITVDGDPALKEQAASADPEVLELQSITTFLTLPIVTARANLGKKDPIINFAKSIVLTSDQYLQAATHLKNTREQAAREKEQKRGERVELQRRKLTEREEANARKAADREEVARLKEQRASEIALERARKAAERQRATREKAEKVALEATVRVARAAEKAERLALGHHQVEHRNSQVAETAEGREGVLDVGHASQIPPSMSGFSFAIPNSTFQPYPQVHAASMPTPLYQPQYQTPIYYTSPTHMSSTMPQSQHHFPQFHVPLRSTLPMVQFPLGCQIPLQRQEHPYPWMTQNLNADEVAPRGRE